MRFAEYIIHILSEMKTPQRYIKSCIILFGSDRKMPRTTYEVSFNPWMHDVSIKLSLKGDSDLMLELLLICSGYILWLRSWKYPYKMLHMQRTIWQYYISLRVRKCFGKYILGKLLFYLHDIDWWQVLRASANQLIFLVINGRRFIAKLYNR